MSNINEILDSAIEYVERVSKEFLEEKGLENSFEKIQKNAEKENTFNDLSKNHYLNKIGYFNSFLYAVIDEVAKGTGKTFEEIKEEFISRYY